MSDEQPHDALLTGVKVLGFIHVLGPAPFLGQHNAEVLKHYLHYDDEHIHQLTQSAALFEEERIKGLRQRGVI